MDRSQPKMTEAGTEPVQIAAQVSLEALLSIVLAISDVNLIEKIGIGHVPASDEPGIDAVSYVFADLKVGLVDLIECMGANLTQLDPGAFAVVTGARVEDHTPAGVDHDVLVLVGTTCKFGLFAAVGDDPPKRFHQAALGEVDALVVVRSLDGSVVGCAHDASPTCY